MRDFHNNFKVIKNHCKQEAGNTAYVVSAARTGFEAIEFIMSLGTLADADTTLTVLVEDSADNSNWTAVDDAYLIGIEAMGLQFDSDNKSGKIGYVGGAKYVRCTVTPSANSGAIDGCLLMIGAHPLLGAINTQVV